MEISLSSFGADTEPRLWAFPTVTDALAALRASGVTSRSLAAGPEGFLLHSEPFGLCQMYN